MLTKLKQTFLDIFNEKNDSEYFSPGRINLIGEHTDYNGGNVFPAAITIGTYGLVRKREDDIIRFYSMNFPEIGVKEIRLSELEYKEDDDWTNYPKGVIYLLKQAGYKINHGFDILFYGTIPNGAGLSSSASIELLTGLIMSDECELNIPRLDLVKLGQKVENDYIGVNSGIMDQFAIGMGEINHAILLNTNTLAYELVPAVFGDYVIMIMNTNKRRELADSKYNERRSECEEALRQLQQYVEINTLCDLSVSDFNKYSDKIDNEVIRKRAKHAITENERTLEAKKALTNGDLKTFGKLLNASHQSLKEDYDVTGIELDTLVDYAQKQPGVLGARMTGAGFGGCAIALVNKHHLAEFKEVVGAGYESKIGYAADFYEASIGDGTKKLS
ncbi:galactokinase [Vagococcus bubulae]|uniref:Galactokinase n=1 Tax=Vagococcus bubulae TaxID=1977868 RepID=A0A429Z9X0_9ENTE|nr:galactokinase [Vagococcus bubulae]RST90499.1 galactokinase [Vagococcus bubulae]